MTVSLDNRFGDDTLSWEIFHLFRFCSFAVHARPKRISDRQIQFDFDCNFSVYNDIATQCNKTYALICNRTTTQLMCQWNTFNNDKHIFKLILVPIQCNWYAKITSCCCCCYYYFFEVLKCKKISGEFSFFLAWTSTLIREIRRMHFLFVMHMNRISISNREQQTWFRKKREE